MQMIPDSSYGFYDQISLSLLGLLWCAGDESDKATVFLKLVTPTAHDQGQISVDDKELIRCL